MLFTNTPQLSGIMICNDEALGREHHLSANNQQHKLHVYIFPTLHANCSQRWCGNPNFCQKSWTCLHNYSSRYLGDDQNYLTVTGTPYQQLTPIHYDIFNHVQPHPPQILRLTVFNELDTNERWLLSGTSQGHNSD